MAGTECAEDSWARVDGYITDTLIGPDVVVDAALRASSAAGLPSISVSPPQGKLLQLLARSVGAKRILEIGTLGGYSAIWLARGLPSDGRLVTLEIDARNAEVARANIEHAGLAPVVDVQVGPASETLRHMIERHEPTFDLIFIDADKVGYPSYLDVSLQLSRKGTVIVLDNMVRNGAVADIDSDDPRVLAVRACLDRIAADPRLSGTVIQTVGTKGYDGFALAVVTEEAG